MAIEFKGPEQIANQYLTHLKALKPEVDTAQTDSDWWVRSRVVGGVISGVYSDLRLISQDAFPQSARREALAKHLDLYFGSGFRTATASNGDVAVTGTPGSIIPAGTEFTYSPNGNVYQSDSQVVLDGTTGSIPVTSVSTGQSQNLLAGASLTISTPPLGVNSDATALTDLSDGRNDESNDEARQRILDRVRQPISGGTESDYRNWAIAANASVSQANVIRHIYGPGTVGVVFTAGTTDIDEALDNGQPIVREPSDELVQIVQDYIDTQKPLTDCAFVFKPTSISVDVTVNVRFADGDLNTVPPGQTLTQEQLVIREVQRAIYKTPPGGRRFGASGFVVLSEIEEVLDIGLSFSPYTTGIYAEILADRQVENLAASGPNLMLLEDQIAEPGTIQVVML